MNTTQDVYKLREPSSRAVYRETNELLEALFLEKGLRNDKRDTTASSGAGVVLNSPWRSWDFSVAISFHDYAERENTTSDITQVVITSLEGVSPREHGALREKIRDIFIKKGYRRAASID